MTIGAATGVDPRPDVGEFRSLLKGSLRRAKARHVVADAGYDSEANHACVRKQCKVPTRVPAKAGRSGQGSGRGNTAG